MNVLSIKPGYLFLLKTNNNSIKLTSNSTFWNDLKFELGSHRKFSDDQDSVSFLKNNLYNINAQILSNKGKKGIALSCGLDSTLILKVSEKINTEYSALCLSNSFSACSTNNKYSEKYWMDESLKNSRLNSHFIFPEGNDVMQKTEALVYQLDEPYHSQRPLLSSLFYEEAAKQKNQFVLNGTAADALLDNTTLKKFNFLYQDLINFRILPLFIDSSHKCNF